MTLPEVRFVVLDSETTGLDPRKDRLVSIGAVGMKGGDILLQDSFEALLKVEYNTSAVTVHGVTRDESLAGFDEEVAVKHFRDYAGDAVLVGHHVRHDLDTLDVAYERHLGCRLENTSIDTMDLTLHLEKDGAFSGRDAITSFTLDSLCLRFGVRPHDRHTAPGDAFLTALVFQRLLRLAARHGRTTLAALAEPFPVEGH